MPNYLKKITRRFSDEERQKALSEIKRLDWRVRYLARKFYSLELPEALHVAQLGLLAAFADGKKPLEKSNDSLGALRTEVAQAHGSPQRFFKRRRLKLCDPQATARDKGIPRIPLNAKPLIDPTYSELSREQRKRLWGIVRMLPFRHRVLIVGEFSAGRTKQEMCEKWGITPTAYWGMRAGAFRRMKNIANGTGKAKAAHPETITVNGQTKTIHEWAQHWGMSRQALYLRVKNGDTWKEAVSYGKKKSGRPNK